VNSGSLKSDNTLKFNLHEAGNVPAFFFALVFVRVVKKCSEKSKWRVVANGGNPMIGQSSGGRFAPVSGEAAWNPSELHEFNANH